MGRASTRLLKEGGISPPYGFPKRGNYTLSGGSIMIQIDTCTGFYCIYSSNVLCSCTEVHMSLCTITHLRPVRIS